MNWSYPIADDTSHGTPVPMDQAPGQEHGVFQPADFSTMPLYEGDHHHEAMGVATTSLLPQLEGQTCLDQEMEIDSHTAPAGEGNSHAPMNAIERATATVELYQCGFSSAPSSCACCSHSVDLAFTAVAPGPTSTRPRTPAPKTTAPAPPLCPTTPTRRYVPKVTDFALPRFRRYRQSLEWRPVERWDQFDKYN